MQKSTQEELITYLLLMGFEQLTRQTFLKRFSYCTLQIFTGTAIGNVFFRIVDKSNQETYNWTQKYFDSVEEFMLFVDKLIKEAKVKENGKTCSNS